MSFKDSTVGALLENHRSLGGLTGHMIEPRGTQSATLGAQCQILSVLAAASIAYAHSVLTQADLFSTNCEQRWQDDTVPHKPPNYPMSRMSGT